MTHTSNDKNAKPPLWKQLCGSAVGVIVAMGMYELVKFSVPAIEANLLKPQAVESAPALSDEAQKEAFAKIGARAREIMQERTEQK